MERGPEIALELLDYEIVWKEDTLEEPTDDASIEVKARYAK